MRTSMMSVNCLRTGPVATRAKARNGTLAVRGERRRQLLPVSATPIRRAITSDVKAGQSHRADEEKLLVLTTPSAGALLG